MSNLPPPPSISVATRYVAGHSLLVHGLEELSSSVSHVTILWLHHGRLNKPDDMAEFAARSVGAFLDHPSSADRGLLAVAFEQRNHGDREVCALANQGWAQGNPTHAQDMFGLVAGAAVDNSMLIDLVQGKLFPEKPAGFVDSHYVAGFSLGGHGSWQLLFADERVTTVVSVVGCPDYMYLLSDRAERAKLPTSGPDFLGSKDFPPDLVSACKKYDPKGLLFGTQDPKWPLPDYNKGQVKQLLESRLQGKKMLNCYGEADKVVPYRCSEPFVNFFKEASKEWAADLDFTFDNRGYPGVAHKFSDDMVLDAVKFIVHAAGGELESRRVKESRI